jgi:hypothetical protein
MDPFRHLVGLLGWGISPAPRPLPTQDNTTQRNADTSMPRAGFEPAIPIFERPKTVLALDRAAIETGIRPVTNVIKQNSSIASGIFRKVFFLLVDIL